MGDNIELAVWLLVIFVSFTAGSIDIIIAVLLLKIYMEVKSENKSK